MNKLLKMGAALGLAIGGLGSASAADCQAVAQSGYFSYHPECNVALQGQLLTYSPIFQMMMLNQIISLQRYLGYSNTPGQYSEGIKGLSAGADMPKWNVWGSGSNNNTGLSKASGNPLNFDGNQNVFSVGADYRLSPATAMGVSIAYDDGVAKLKNSNGQSVTNSGYNIAPYFAYQINKNYSMDVIAGFGWGELRRNGGGMTQYRADTERRFAGANFNAGYWLGNVQLTGKASLFYSHQRNDADLANFLDASTKYVTQGRLGAQAAYWMGNGFAPYVSLAYVNDIARNSTYGVSLDRDGFVAGLGVNYFSRGGVTGGVSYTSEFGRDNVTNNVFMANVNVRF